MWPKTPKARLFLAILGFLLLIAVVIIIALANSGEPKKKPIKLADIIRQNPNLTEDDDKDGLKNWEEQIYQTDPKNPDTDGDGANDGEEITQGRDPLKKGPNDKIVIKNEAGEAETRTTNLTDEFTENFIRGPVTKIIVGEKPTINTDLVEAYADNLLQKSILDAAPKINEAELKKNPANTLETIQKYLQDFEKIWKADLYNRKRSCRCERHGS